MVNSGCSTCHSNICNFTFHTVALSDAFPHLCLAVHVSSHKQPGTSSKYHRTGGTAARKHLNQQEKASLGCIQIPGTQMLKGILTIPKGSTGSSNKTALSIIQQKLALCEHDHHIVLTTKHQLLWYTIGDER